MKVPPLMSISTHLSEVIDLEARVCLHVPAVIPSLPLCVSSQDTLMSSSRASSLYVTCASLPLLLCALCSFSVSRRFGQARSSLPRPPLSPHPTPSTYAKENCKMAPRRKSETCARLSVSAVGNKFRLRSVFWLYDDFRQTRKHA